MLTGSVSIIIPCYNAKRFLRETVVSALQQTYPSFEVIVIDDGSTDDPAAVVREFGDRVQVASGPNRGVSAARNRGTELARGEFLQYLDADDLLEPNALAERVAALQKTGADVAYADWQPLEESASGEFIRKTLVSHNLEDVDPDPEVAIFRSFWAPLAALLYRRTIVERIGGWHTGLPVIQDARFLQDAAFHGARFVRVTGVGANYRVQRQLSLSRRNAVAFARDCFRNAVETHARWETQGGLTSTRRRALLEVYGGVARQSFEQDKGTFTEAWRALEVLEPGYCPTSSRSLPIATRLFGYQRAELIALWYRRWKRLFGR